MRRLWLLVPMIALLLGGLAVVPTAGSATPAPPTALADSRADSWVPPSGVAFNLPRSGAKARTKLIRRVIAGINHAPKGSTIRFAMYSFDRKDVTQAILKARKRGVHVQMIVNDNWTSPQTRQLRRVLGTKPKKKNFYVICHGACRGGKGNLHMKVYAFERTGAANKVIMTGSSNLTDRAVSLQWNDQVTLLNQPGLYDAFLKIFGQLKFDKKVKKRRLTYNGDPTFDALFYKEKANRTSTVNSSLQPRVPGPSKDPVLKRLKAVNCTAKAGFGIGGKTSIRIIMYGWNKVRGNYLADRIALMKRQGCNIAIITSVAGGAVVKKINRARIPLKSADYDYQTNLVTEEETVNFYSHLKVLMVNGTYQGKSVKTVWSGSENWSGTSFLNDELIIHMTGTSVYNRYLKQFQLIWNKFSHAVGVHPINLP